MSYRPRPSALVRHTVPALLPALAALLLASAPPALADETCTSTPETASELVRHLKSPPKDAVICLLEGASHVFSEAYLDTSHALPPIHSSVTIRGQGEGSTIQRSSTATSAFGLFAVTEKGHLTLSNVTLRNGLAASTTPGGGAILVDGGSLTINNSTFLENTAQCNDNYPSQPIARGTFSSCSGSQGAAIYTNSSLNIYTSTFSGNTATGTGGAIYAQNGPLEIYTSTFKNNSGSQGGAIYTSASTAKIYTSTFSGNTAGTNGGAIYAQNGLAIHHSTFSSANSSGTLYSGPAPTLISSIFDETEGSVCAGQNKVNQTTYSLFSDDSCLNSDQYGDIPNGSLGLAKLDNYGGPTETIALQADSPAINIGSCPKHVPDQRGVPRKSSCDAGAFERLCHPVICEDKTCTIDVWVDFKNTDPDGYSEIVNSGDCEVSVIPKDATKLQWRIVPLNGFIGSNAASLGVEEIIYTALQQEPQKKKRTEGPPTLPPEEERLKPCVFQNSQTTTPEPPKKDGWVVYSYSNLEKRDPSGCRLFDLPPGSHCNCAPKKDKHWWWYGVNWSGKLYNGLWDPRMRAQPTDDPPGDPFELPGGGQ